MGKFGRKKILAIDYKTNKRIKEFDSITLAAKELNLDRSSIQRCLAGEYYHTHGYTFRYLEENYG